MADSPNLDQSSSSDLPDKVKPWQGSSHFVNQGRHWSSALIWLFASLFGCTIIWAFTARLDQTVVARGRLQPSGSVRDVDSPSAGVVSTVLVSDGDMVEAGQSLFSVEAAGLKSRRQALDSTLVLLDLQARAVRSILASNGDPSNFAPLPPIPPVDNPELSSQLITARRQVEQLRSTLEQLNTQLKSRNATLALKTQIAADLKPLFDTGAMSRNQYLEELNRVQEIRASVATLEEELARNLGVAATQLDTLNKRIIELRAQRDSIDETLSYRTVKAPISGMVFDLQVTPSSVVNADQEVLKIIPKNQLEAKVSIEDSDIGFVRVGMPVNVSVSSFPSGEFGYIQGELVSLGSDVLEPDASANFYRFPAIVSLKQQEVVSGSEKLNLQSGMSVTALIKLRSRPAITVVTDMFTKQFEGVQQFR